MNDFLDCCRTLRAERDDARLEADRLRAEIGRIAKERDDARAEMAMARESHLDLYVRYQAATESAKLRAERAAFVVATAEPLKPYRGKAEAFEIAEKIEEIVSGTLRDEPGTAKCDQCDPWQRLARIAALAGRLIVLTR